MSVYFVQPTGGGFIKIGTTSNGELRVNDYRAMHPMGVELLAMAEGGFVREALIHRFLTPSRFRDEWFRSEPAVWRVVLDALDTGLSWLPEEPNFFQKRELAKTIRQDGAKMFGGSEVFRDVCGLTKNAFLTATRDNCSVNVLVPYFIRKMEIEGSIPAYLRWEGLQ